MASMHLVPPPPSAPAIATDRPGLGGLDPSVRPLPERPNPNFDPSSRCGTVWIVTLWVVPSGSSHSGWEIGHTSARTRHTTAASPPWIYTDFVWTHHPLTMEPCLSVFWDIALTEKLLTGHTVSLEDRVSFLSTEWAWMEDPPNSAAFTLQFGPHQVMFLFSVGPGLVRTDHNPKEREHHWPCVTRIP